MSVKCLNQHQKKYIKYYINKGTMSQRALARQFKVSARTIGRVINEPDDFDAI